MVCGLEGQQLKKLLSEANLTLTSAVEVVQSMKAAQKDAQTLKNPQLPIGKLEKQGASSHLAWHPGLSLLKVFVEASEKGLAPWLEVTLRESIPLQSDRYFQC